MIVAAASLAVAAALPAGEASAAARSRAAGRRTVRRLGTLDVSPLGLGCMSMGPGFYNPRPDRQDMVRLIRAAAERGVTLFDTAEVYGPHISEEIVGEALQPIREQVVIATKVGFEIDPAVVNSRVRNARPEHLRRAVEGSLRRLRTDHIDLLYLHRIDPKVPVEDVAATVVALVKEGKVRHFGLSEVTTATIERAHRVHRLSAIQSEYSIFEKAPELDVLKTCERLGIGFVAWGPTMRGLLADGFNEYSRFSADDRRASVPFLKPEALEANMAVVRLVRTWADRMGVTPVQFVLAWLLAEKPFIVPIPGSIRLHHVEENLGALQVALDDAQRARFRTELAALRIIGARTPDAAMRDL